MADYSELLKHPNWQRKRLEILNRDEFTCKCCGATDKTLHVHHFKYLNGHMPWEYDNDNFITMCDECHSEEEQFIRHKHNGFIKINRLYNFPVRKMWHFSFSISFLYDNDPEAYEQIKKLINDSLEKNWDKYSIEWDNYHG